ncbi:MAG TPA: hypothetical protein VMV13_06695 [Candidatus Binataceae bacterium]|nr:hypothetical protein [Candidatus Binataceae bacterium]
MSAQVEPASALASGAPVAPAGPVAGTAFKAVMAIFVAAGVIGFALNVGGANAARAWQAYLVNLLVWLGIAQGGVVMLAAFYLCNGRWAGTTQYRLAETFAGFIPLGFLLFFGLYFGRTLIFPWVLHPIAQKAAWLNTPFLFARDGIGLAIMTVLSLWLVRLSRTKEAAEWQRDSESILLVPNPIRRVAPALAICFAIVYTIIAFDLVMSLAPVWRSTLFGWYFFAGAFWSAAAAMALVAVIMRGLLGGNNAFKNPQVMRDIGLTVFAFSIFWIYLLFAQYIVIWYGDIPVETFFIVVRAYYPPWQALSYAVVILMWMIPFLTLLGVRPKKTPAILGAVSLCGVIGIWLERYVLVVPSLSPHTVPFGWVEILVTLGFFGAFVLCSLPGLDRLAASAAREVWVEEHE